MGNKGLNNNNIKLVNYTIVGIDRKHDVSYTQPLPLG